jgi:hypothetical protein
MMYICPRFRFKSKFYSDKYLNGNENKTGTMAEWLGKALQKLLQQFESVWYLRKASSFW